MLRLSVFYRQGLGLGFQSNLWVKVDKVSEVNLL